MKKVSKNVNFLIGCICLQMLLLFGYILQYRTDRNVHGLLPELSIMLWAEVLPHTICTPSMWYVVIFITMDKEHGQMASGYLFQCGCFFEPPSIFQLA